MAATAAVNRPPPAHPGPIGGNLHSHPNSGVPHSGHQDPGLHGSSQDPGPPPHPQHHVSSRPVFYIPAPPPPPFLQYQWPMPFSYNPFAGFPGMGYGMVMPPLPPPPYMEAPAYIVPHPHIQPVDYRRLVHPQVHAPSAPYQNPNQTRRIHPHTVPVRETISSAVQTEPTQTGMGGYDNRSPAASSDSGHGTASSSPSSSNSSSQKRGSTEIENYTCSSNAKDLQVKRTCTNNPVKHDFNIPHPTRTNTEPPCIRATVETQKHHKDSVGHENVPPCRNHSCNMWSVGSQDSMVPVCSSHQQEDGIVKERRVSVPDILMSWGGGTPPVAMLKMTDKVLPQSDVQLPSYETVVEHKSIYKSPTEKKNGPVGADLADDDAENVLSSKDSETLFKILKLPSALHELLSESRSENEPVGLVGSVRPCPPYRDELLHSLNRPHKLPDDEQEPGNETNPHQDTPEMNPYQISLNSCQMKLKMNESVWSVDSLAPFIPTKEWLLQKSMFEPEIIIEMTEEAENGRLLAQNDYLNDQPSKERRQSHRLSSSDSVPMSDSWLIFSTPAEKLRPSKKPEMVSEIDACEMREPQQGQSRAPSEKDPLVSPTHLQSKIVSTPTEEDVDDNRSSEPEANQSPNQESLIVNEQQEKRPCSPEQVETLLVNSVAGEKISQMGLLIFQNGVDMKENGACGNKEVSQLRKEQLSVPMADQRMAQVFQSKGHLVDCGIQFPELEQCIQESMSSTDPSRRNPYKYSDIKKANGGKAEGFCVNGQKNQKRSNQWRKRGQGGKGRNPRY